MDVNFAMHDMCVELYLLGRSLHLLAGACFLLCFDVVEMFNKRSLPDEALEDIPEEKRLRHDLLDVFLGNNLSAQGSARVFENANLAGAANVDDLAVNRKRGNQARDLLRKAFRNTKWPPVYTFTAVSYNPAKQKNQTQDLSMLLPHELVHSLLKVNEPEDLMSRQESLLGNRADLQLHLDKMHNYGFEKTETLLTGLWMDGVPFNSDRSQSLETVVMNILCDSTMRLPIACFPKEFAAKKKTYECVFDVLRWSFGCLMVGQFPSCRHDGSPFGSLDSYRAKRKLQPLGLKACLAEVRADWSAYKDILDFPSWSSTGHICWRCNCTKSDLKKFQDQTLEKLLWAALDFSAGDMYARYR